MLSRKIQSFLFPIILVCITGLISFQNYTPGTFLTGWDTLHPEFDFAQSFSNVFYGAFRTDQGLGAVAAHAHMVELPRIALLWILSNLLPLSFLRYAVVFLCFILGPLGIFFFTKKVLSIKYRVTRENEQNSEYRILNTQVPAFLAALVYIFNLGTVQHFYLPFEMFMVQYAALGFLFLTALQFTEHSKLSHLLVFALVTLLASSMAYAPVLWYAYFAAFLLFIATLCLVKRDTKTILASIILVATTLIVNAYWILPNLYFLATAAGNVSAAQINRIFSDEAFLHNKQYGNIVDTAILRSFLFNWTEQLDVNTAQDLMVYWKNHIANPFTASIGYAVFVISCLGLLISILKKNLVGIALIPVFFLAIIMLMNMNPPFDPIFAFLRDNFSLFREGLRFPFTKFSLLLMFSMSVFFAIAMAEILHIIQRQLNKSAKVLLSLGIALLFSLSLVWYGFPMFTGNLIDRQMRINIPDDYFKLFDYLGNKPQGARIAPLPLHSLWGWEYYEWGYQGAGFLWFGIKQPVLARDFDRWNENNELYLREMSAAIYSRDTTQVETLAAKYRISYFLLDESIYSPGNKQNALWHYETKSIFEKSRKITLAKKFGKLSLYEVNKSLSGSGFIQKPTNVNLVGPKITGGFVDLAARNYGDYVVADSPGIIFPSRTLVGRYDRIDPKNITLKSDRLTIALGNNYGHALTTSWLESNIFPEFMRSPSYDLATEEKGLPYTIGDDTYFTVPVTSKPVRLEAELVRSNDCGLFYSNSVAEIINKPRSLTFKARGASSCGYVPFPSEKQDFGSILIIEARNQKGLPIRLCISDRLTSRCGIYTALDTGPSWKRYVFMIPPQPSGATGYAVHFNTIGIGRDESINELRYVHFIQIPYYRIANLSFIDENYVPQTNSVAQIRSREINPSLYEANVGFRKGQERLIAFYKAYDPGWKAYEVDVRCSPRFAGEAGQMLDVRCYLPFIFGQEIKDHVLINNWANGWQIEPKSNVSGQMSIVIFYWPQYLQYAGFALLLVWVLGISASMGIRYGHRLRRKNQT